MQFTVKVALVIYFLSTLSIVYAGTCAVLNTAKIDCGYTGITQSQCVAKGCCWQVESLDGTPWCFYSGSTKGYSLSSLVQTNYGYSGVLTSLDTEQSAYGDNIVTLSLQVVFESESVFRIRITDTSLSRYEIPQSLISRKMPEEITKATNTLYEFSYSSYPFLFTVTRVSDGVKVFENSDPIVFKDQFIELSTNYVSTMKTYGLGESTRQNHALTIGSTHTMWNADIAAMVEYENLYGSYPYYLQVGNGKAYGAMLLNSNGMDIQLRNSSITFTTIGGMIDLYVFLGPSAAEVVQQYTSVIGRPAMIPYWSLGFHNCRWGYTSLSEIEEIVANYSAANIPLDTQWMDIDYMQNYRDFTVDSTNFVAADVKSFVDTLHTNGQHFIPIVDPGIMVYSGYDAYESGIEKDLFVKDIQGNYYLGQVWPGPTYFPDFLHPKAQEYWTTQLQAFYNMVDMDGIWIDMNEVSNFCNKDGQGQVCANTSPSGCPADGASQTDCCLVCSEIDSTNIYDYPPYSISNLYGKLGTKTMAMSAYHYDNTSVYNLHNLYGLSEQIATYNALVTVRQKRPFILSRSSFISSGKWTSKWTGDNGATWADLRSSIISIMDFNLFGVPMIGADICGFIDNTTEELCARWIEVGAFYPFSRDHNSYGAAPQELYLWDTVAEAARNALGLRYQLLPYYYTLFYYAHTTGTTVARSIWMNYPSDAIAPDIHSQFMIGGAVLVSPVVIENATEVLAYFPVGNWYDLSTRMIAFSKERFGTYEVLATPLTSINVHLSGGSIVPMQESAMTTTAGRKTPFTLLAGLCLYGGGVGELFWDDGEQLELDDYLTVDYHVKVDKIGGRFTGTVSHDTYADASMNTVGTIIIMGSMKSGLKTPSVTTLNGNKLSVDQILYDSTNHTLTLVNLGLPLNSNIDLVWIY